MKIHIDSTLAFLELTFDSKINMSNCVFEEMLIFRKCIFKAKVDFRESTFKKKVNFNESSFLEKIRFHSSVFIKTVSFRNTTFKELADFWNVTFTDVQRFYLTDFLGVTIFSHVTFAHQVQFIYNKISKDTIISFENADFKQSLDISRANFWCKLNFWSVKINYLPTEIWLYQTDEIIESQNTNNEKAYQVLRETYRIIKDVFYKEGNNIEAISFYMREMSAYGKELKVDNGKNKIEERTSLFFNKISNDFGTSWARGLLFVFGATIIFYSLFLIFLWDEIYYLPTEKGVASFFRHFFEFLNIAKWDIKPFGITDYNYSYIVLFIGRIFIGYGYYQTIQAFRKYGKS
nr:pentapeptide repeat-containing protein [Flavobacterium sp. EDS]